MPEDNLIIEKMTISDIPEVVTIERQSFSDPWEEESFLFDLNNEKAYPLVTKIAGRVVGYICLWIVLDEMQIANIAVSKEYRRQGIGEKLLNYILALAQESKCQEISLDVRKSNISALKLYEKLGFEKKGRRKNYYRFPQEDALILVKEL